MSLSHLAEAPGNRIQLRASAAFLRDRRCVPQIKNGGDFGVFGHFEWGGATSAPEQLSKAPWTSPASMHKGGPKAAPSGPSPSELASVRMFSRRIPYHAEMSGGGTRKMTSCAPFRRQLQLCQKAVHRLCGQYASC